MTKLKSFGVIGLGKMGGGLALQALEKNYTVVGFDAYAVSPELQESAVHIIKSYKDFKKFLKPPRVIFIYVPAGVAVDEVIKKLSAVLDAGDIIVDGGNSYWGDSIRRAQELVQKDIYLLDCGTSGGISGARTGACFMLGGNKKAAKIVMPILQDLAVPAGVVYTGPAGSGHYVKLVHNGIEFGMLQAIAEGIDLLINYPDNLPIEAILKTWNHGSVIRSWLIELMHEQYTKQGLSVPAYIEDTGEVNWLVGDALRFEVSIPVIAQAVMQLIASRDKTQNWAKAIALMRHGFGGHPFGESKAIKKERKTGKLSC